MDNILAIISNLKSQGMLLEKELTNLMNQIEVANPELKPSADKLAASLMTLLGSIDEANLAPRNEDRRTASYSLSQDIKSAIFLAAIAPGK